MPRIERQCEKNEMEKNVNARKRNLSGFFEPGALAQPPSL
jgi:hypothetical protein